MKAIMKYMKPIIGTKKEHPLKKGQQEEEEYIVLTYRSGIEQALPTTYYTSDAGWGCMLRVGQMFLANLYFKTQARSKQEVIKLCYDNKPMPLSLQRLTEVASALFPHKKQYEWFSPCECGFIIKNLLDELDNSYRVSICNDNCVFLSDIQADRDKLIVLVMCRIGLDEPQPEYLQCILHLMKNPYFNSILGGTPKKAHLFFKHEQGYMGFLDPHQTKKVPEIQKLKEKQNQFVSNLSWMKEGLIDCSMALAFTVPQSHLNSFWGSLKACKDEVGEKFFLYLAEQRPDIDENQFGAIEICQQNF